MKPIVKGVSYNYNQFDSYRGICIPDKKKGQSYGYDYKQEVLREGF